MYEVMLGTNGCFEFVARSLHDSRHHDLNPDEEYRKWLDVGENAPRYTVEMIKELFPGVADDCPGADADDDDAEDANVTAFDVVRRATEDR